MANRRWPLGGPYGDSSQVEYALESDTLVCRACDNVMAYQIWEAMGCEFVHTAGCWVPLAEACEEAVRATEK